MMNPVMTAQSQLLATKFFAPTVAHTLIARPRLVALLEQSLEYPLTLISAPAGFGKTTMLATWAQSLQARSSVHFCWLSLDEEENDPQLFWTYVLSALDQQQPGRFARVLNQLPFSSSSPEKYFFTSLINLLTECPEQFVLILDDYHLITTPEIHEWLLYLIEHVSPQLRIILATRVDPPLPLIQLQARQRVLQIRADQLRCTLRETQEFFHLVMHLQLPPEVLALVTARTEGWLVGLQLLGLSLPGQNDPAAFLKKVGGNQRHILDYLTQEVLERQSPDVQSFLLSTCILEQLGDSLCDAVRGEHDSNQMLKKLEQTNLFIVALDSKRQWYRYHALFAEALHYQLERTYADLLPTLHYRASCWYAQHERTFEAILHALHAKEWQWASDLIERKSLALNTLSWGISHYHLFLLRDWLMQIPADMVKSRPGLCLARIWMLLFITPRAVLESWLNAVEETLTHALTENLHQRSSYSIFLPQTKQELDNMLGEAMAYRALLQIFDEHGEAVLPLCEQAQALLSEDNFGARSHIAAARLKASYTSSVNDAEAAIQVGLQVGSLNQMTGNTDQTISLMGVTAMHMLGTGRLRGTEQLAQQAILLGRKPDACVLPAVGWPTVWQAEVLRQRNQLARALSCIEEAIKLLAQLEWTISPLYVLLGYTILLRISLSRGELDAGSSALQEIERIGMNMPEPVSIYYCSHFTIVDQIRLWLARGELNRARRWAEMLDAKEQHNTPFTREREEVARACIFLATRQPDLALQRLEPVLLRATAGQRWDHVIEIRLLQALAYHMSWEETQALDALSQAVRLGEPEGYIRSFLDEGSAIEGLLLKLRKRDRKGGPTPYLDTMLDAFQQENKNKGIMQSTGQTLPEPLSGHERQVLHLLAQEDSYQEIAEALAIAIGTVKRHATHIFAKLGAQNRRQALKQAQSLGLLQ